MDTLEPAEARQAGLSIRSFTRARLLWSNSSAGRWMTTDSSQTVHTTLNHERVTLEGQPSVGGTPFTDTYRLTYRVVLAY